MISVNFLHVTGKSISTAFSPNECIGDMKQRLFGLWTRALPPLQGPEQLRLIYGGKVLSNAQNIGEVFKQSLATPDSSPVTVHMLVSEAGLLPALHSFVRIRSLATEAHLKLGDEEATVHGHGGTGRRSTFVLRPGLLPESFRFECYTAPGTFLRIRKSDATLRCDGHGGTWCHWRLLSDESATGNFRLHHIITGADLRLTGDSKTDLFRLTTVTPKASWPHFDVTVQTESPAEEPIHFHGCAFDEDEVSQVELVFNRQKNKTTDKIDIQEVWKFLKSYWSYMQRIHQPPRHVGEEFPVEHFKALKLRVIGTESQLTLDQFVQFWFLFDNNAPEEPCQHGQKQRVQAATVELHKNLKPDSEFEATVFDRVFQEIDRHGHGQLTCKEVELLYYMYSLHVTVHQ